MAPRNGLSVAKIYYVSSLIYFLLLDSKLNFIEQTGIKPTSSTARSSLFKFSFAQNIKSMPTKANLILPTSIFFGFFHRYLLSTLDFLFFRGVFFLCKFKKHCKYNLKSE